VDWFRNSDQFKHIPSMFAVRCRECPRPSTSHHFAPGANFLLAMVGSVAESPLPEAHEVRGETSPSLGLCDGVFFRM